MSKKKMLIYAHYYAPDVASTGQILQDLAEGLNTEFDITVICTVPSYTGKIEDKYKKQKYYNERINGVNILRVSVSEFSKSSKISRIKNLIEYFSGAKRATKFAGKQDYIFTISQPPIMGGMLGVYGKKKVGGKLVYCIQDFNPEQIEATGYIKIKPLLYLAKCIDNKSCKKSDLVVTVGSDLVDTLKKRFYGKKIPNYVMINNWINEEEIYPLPANNPNVIEFKKQYGLENKFIFMYSGNLGIYYDLEGIIKLTEEFKNSKTKDEREVVFVFVGEGSIKDKLVEYKNTHQLDNVVFIPYQEKNKLIYSLNAADVHLCINAMGIKGVSCPSKFYGIAAVGKPILGVLQKDSEIERLITEIKCGKVCEPEEYNLIKENIKWFISLTNDNLSKMGELGHSYLVNYLSKAESVNKYKDAITNC